MDHTIVMSERKNGFFLYLHSEKQFYTYNAPSKKIPGKIYRCQRKDLRCPARIILTDNGSCVQPPDAKPHNHSGDCELRFFKLRALEECKKNLSSVETLASGSRIAKPRAVYKAAIIK